MYICQVDLVLSQCLFLPATPDFQQHTYVWQLFSACIFVCQNALNRQVIVSACTYLLAHISSNYGMEIALYYLVDPP